MWTEHVRVSYVTSWPKKRHAERAMVLKMEKSSVSASMSGCVWKWMRFVRLCRCRRYIRFMYASGFRWQNFYTQKFSCTAAGFSGGCCFCYALNIAERHRHLVHGAFSFSSYTWRVFSNTFTSVFSQHCDKIRTYAVGKCIKWISKWIFAHPNTQTKKHTSRMGDWWLWK